MNLGEKIFELRKRKNLSQEEVAEILNVTRQTISKWETNQSTPDFDKIIPLCELFEISADELLKGEKNSKEINEDDSINSSKEFDWNEAKKHLFTRGKDDEDYENMTKNQIKQKSAKVISTSVFIYIAAIAFLMVAIPVFKINPIVASAIFLLLIAWATAKIIKHYMSIPKFEKTAEEKKQDTILKEINGIIGAICTVIYFIVSFATMAWYITWIIFIIDGMICQIIKLLFMLKEEKVDEE